MQTRRSKLAQAVAGVALLAGAFSTPAAADVVRHHYVHHRMAHRIVHPANSEDVVVRTPAPAAPVRDAFHGPAAVVTGPVAVGGTIVHWPFVAIESVFPPTATDPRVVVGAPVHVAGELAGLPFYVVNSTLGAPSYY